MAAATESDHRTHRAFAGLSAGTGLAPLFCMLKIVGAVELLNEVLGDEQDVDELYSVLLTCQRALRDFELALANLEDLDRQIESVDSLSDWEELESELDWIEERIRGTAVEAHTYQTRRDLERQRHRLSPQNHDSCRNTGEVLRCTTRGA